MEHTRALRRWIGADRDFTRLDVQAQRVAELAHPGTLGAYLERARIEIERFSAQPPMRLRIARFSEFGLAHVRVSGLSSRWHRGSGGAERALILVVQQGSLYVTGPDGVARRGRGAWVVPPGPGAVAFETPEERTDFVCISVPARLAAAVLPAHGGSIVHSDAAGVAPGLFAPAAAFVAQVCAMAPADVPDGDPLQSVVEEVARSVVRLTGSAKSDGPATLYGAAVATIRRGYASPTMNSDWLARELGVSVRTLQTAFRGEGRTVAGVIRQTRAVAAVELQHEQPDLTQAQIAGLVGFGSTDSLQRAVHPGTAG